MAELDTLTLKNPTSEDFTHNYNGEPYTIKAGEEKSFAKHVAFHLAKHLSTKMVQDDVLKSATKIELKENETKMSSRLGAKISQLNIYDTPERRIALYKIFGDKSMVEQTIRAYPFKGFVGDMAIYDSFVVRESNGDKV